ncbi:MAG: molybdopterin cofactor-binding domain-containing protein [Pirellula sp.]
MPSSHWATDMTTNNPFDEELIEAERYELREPSVYRFDSDRRGFVQALGGGLMLAASVVHSNQAQAQRGRTARREELLSERFHLGIDGVVTVLTSKVEVGQGSRTQLTQAVAEEFRIPLDRIRLIMADTVQCPDDGGTAGSRTTPSTVPRVRNAAAAIREVLVNHAALTLGVDAARISIQDGVFVAADGAKLTLAKLTLAELANDSELSAKLKVAPKSDVQTTSVEQWRILGTSVAKVGGKAVVTGEAKYPSDIRRPGMLYGKILRPISYGAKLKSVDVSVVATMKDVVVVRDGDFLGCVAPTSWQAAKARDAIATTVQWDRPEHPSSSELFPHLKRTAKPNARGQAVEAKSANAPSGDLRKLATSYTVAYIQHAPMEPRAAVAEWTDGALSVWTGSQQPARVQSDLMQAFRLPQDKVHVIIPDTGGGFGGKHTGEAAVEAARLAKSAGRPVSLRWTREEEFTWAYFRPAGLIEVEASLDRTNKIVEWKFTNYNSGGSAIESPYKISNAVNRFVETDSPLKQGSYRALASTANTFARESAMDELAKLCGMDPLAFRLQHLPDGRLKDVLVAAADRFDWTKRRKMMDGKGEKGSGTRGIGLSCGTEKGSYVAACVEVELNDGQIHVRSVYQAFECGAIQNPANLRSQVEGSIIMGLGGALFEGMEFKSGQILNNNFSSYRVPRMSDMPSMEIVLLDRKDLTSVGGSETPIIAIAPAIANAVDHAVNIRSRSLPLRLT